MEVICALLGALIGGALVFLVMQGRRSPAAAAEQRLSDTFASLSQQALAKTSEQLLQLANENYQKHAEGASSDLLRRQQAIEQLVVPLKESLEKLDKSSLELEQKRLVAYEGVAEHISRLMVATTQLSSALRRPHVRGSWGELTLRRSAEGAGLREGQDFKMQASTNTEDGRLRPDMVVYLPNEGVIVVDSKVPLENYLEAMQASDEATRDVQLRAHAVQVRKHILALSSKEYWRQFERSPDFVVMFIPAESLYQLALEQDPDLLDAAFKAKVILANPMTLVALLRTVSLAMNQQRVQQSAQEIQRLGERLYDSVRTFTNHFAAVGKHLAQTTEAYNRSIGSVERNVLPKARQLKDHGAGSGEDLELPEQIVILPRSVEP